MRAKADALGETAGVEWRLSPALVPYEAAVSEMEERAEAILLEQKPELIWLLEHPPLYTAGTSSKPADLIDAARFPVHASGRGGQYTYHGPGQLVAYVHLDLNKRGRDVRQHVQRLEAWAIAALAHLRHFRRAQGRTAGHMGEEAGTGGRENRRDWRARAAVGHLSRHRGQRMPRSLALFRHRALRHRRCGRHFY